MTINVPLPAYIQTYTSKAPPCNAHILFPYISTSSQHNLLHAAPQGAHTTTPGIPAAYGATHTHTHTSTQPKQNLHTLVTKPTLVTLINPTVYLTFSTQLKGG